MKSIHVPIYKTDETVEIQIDSLSSQSPEDVMMLLIDEKAPLEIWFNVAIEYYRLNLISPYESILNIAALRATLPSTFESHLSPCWSLDRHKQFLTDWNLQGGGKAHPNYDQSLVLILSSLAGYYISMARHEKDPKKRSDLYIHATKLFHRADQTIKNHWLTSLGKAFVYLYQGFWDKALKQFQTTLHDHESRTARLGLALCWIKCNKPLLALEELSRIFISIYTTIHEPIPSHLSSKSNHLSPTLDQNPLSTILGHDFDPTFQLLSNYHTLRPLLALVWQQLQSPDRAITSLTIHIHHLESTSHPPPPHHDYTLTILAILLINRYHERQFVAKNSTDILAANQDLIQANKYLQQALKINPNNAMALNQWANIVFTRKDLISGDFSMTKKLAIKAYHHATLNETKAESCYYLGRVYHVQKDLDTAFKYYTESIVNWPSFTLPYYGLGQIQLSRHQNTQAIESFLKVDVKYPDFPPVKNILGHLYAKLSATHTATTESNEYYEKAVHYLERSLFIQPKQAETWIELAQLLTPFEPQRTLHAYEKAVELLTLESSQAWKRELSAILSDNEEELVQLDAKSVELLSLSQLVQLKEKVQFIDLPPRTLWHNIAVLRMQCGDDKASQDALMRTLLLGACTPLDVKKKIRCQLSQQLDPSELRIIYQAIFNTPITEMISTNDLIKLSDLIDRYEWMKCPINITTTFNMAYFYESHQFHHLRAQSIYRQVLTQVPSYLDAQFRLACIEHRTGSIQHAIDIFNQIYQGPISQLASTSHEHRQTACLYLVNIYMEIKDYKLAQHHLESLLHQGKSSGNGTVDLYALIQLGNIFLVASSMANDRQERNLKYATDLFSSVLKQTPGNLYAANGLGIVFALRQTSTHYRNAMDIFHAVREGSTNIPDTLINLGHLYYMQGDYQLSIRMYNNTIQKFGIQIPQIQQSHLPIMLARCYFEIGNFEMAKATLQIALHEKPTEEDLWYNLAVMCKDLGLSVLKRVGANPVTKAMVEASITSEGRGKNSPSKEDIDIDRLLSQNLHSSQGSEGNPGNQSNIINNGAKSHPIAQNINRKMISIPTEAEQRVAIQALKVAAPIFERLQVESSSKRSFVSSKCAKFAKLCTTNRELAEEKLEAFREEQERLYQLRKTKLDEAREQELKNNRQIEEANASEQARLRLLQHQAEEYLQRTAELQEEWASISNERANKNTGSKGSGESYEENEQLGNSEHGGNRKKRKRKNVDNAGSQRNRHEGEGEFSMQIAEHSSSSRGEVIEEYVEDEMAKTRALEDLVNRRNKIERRKLAEKVQHVED